eukprot:GHVU01169662.1.p3 GENE.GHVU01169662.1~~GHVU01169662.1.p3  ORF type:complete len:154 (+),score=25.86 GHVU01169662.1:1516-1977(+)
MRRPHPRHGMVNDAAKYVYGIRDVSVLANRLESIVQNCEDAANTDDARDKVFFEPAAEFNSVLAERVKTMGPELAKRLKNLGNVSGQLSGLSDRMDGCLNEKDGYDKHIKKSLDRIAKSQSNLSEVEGTIMSRIEAGSLRNKLMAGDTYGRPA